MHELRCFVWALTVLLASSGVDAAGPAAAKRPAKSKKPTLPEPPVAAMVGDEPVYVAEVDDLLADAAKTGAGGGEELRPAALEQAINRRLVAQHLAAQGYAVDEAETDDLIKELKRKLEVRQVSFEEFLQRHGFNELIVRRRLRWDVMWAAFLPQAATDEALEEFFESRRREYDGRELRVSHILWPVKPPGDKTNLAAAVEEAEQVRSQIVSGKLSFAKAAEKHSAGPSRRRGGDLGFIPLHDRMTESFSRAAFQLEKGEVSPPVVDQFGVHLIQCTDVKQGDKDWRDVRRELVEAFAREKFSELAAARRKETTVKIMDPRRP